jgi:hypothetical protein
MESNDSLKENNKHIKKKKDIVRNSLKQYFVHMFFPLNRFK